MHDRRWDFLFEVSFIASYIPSFAPALILYHSLMANIPVQVLLAIWCPKRKLLDGKPSRQIGRGVLISFKFYWPS